MDFWVFYDLIFLAAGFYCCYLWGKSKSTSDLEQLKLILPRNLKPEQCLDSDGFLAAILPYLLAMGIVLLLNGLITLLQDLGTGLPDILSWVGLAAVVLVIVLFIRQEQRAVDIFWDHGD